MHMQCKPETIPNSYLLVDDDELFRQTLYRALQRRGFQVAAAPSIKAAMTTLQHFTPEGAILDLKLPGEHGVDLIKPLLQKNAAIKIVVLTGFGSIATAVAAIKNGAFNYITKPADVEQILNAFGNNANIVAQAESVQTLSQMEHEHIQTVLRACHGNISHAAKALGIHRRSLQRKLNTYQTTDN